MADAYHDFRCPRCGTIRRDVPIPISVGAGKARIACPTCTIGEPPATVCPVIMDWIPAIGRIDCFSDGQFQKFAITETVRGEERTTLVDSLHKLRQVERTSEQLARNGEGRPLVWRDYAQDRSNFDQHTLGKNIGDPHGVSEVVARNLHKVRKGAAVIADHGTVGE